MGAEFVNLRDQEIRDEGNHIARGRPATTQTPGGANAKWDNKPGACRTRKGVPLFGLVTSQAPAQTGPDVAAGHDLLLSADAFPPAPLPEHFRRGEMACIHCGHATETGVVTEISVTGLHEGGCWAAYVAGVALQKGRDE